MKFRERVDAFVVLGEMLNEITISDSSIYSKKYKNILIEAENCNPWFTKRNVNHAISQISNILTLDNLCAWLEPYSINDEVYPKKVLIVMAGNIPLVGFHDFLSVVITGNISVVKLSNKDQVLFRFIISLLTKIDIRFDKYLLYIEDLSVKNFDAVIATGSDNSSKYFNYYFKNVPKIIRHSRSSICVIDGSEDENDLDGLARDIFMYFGLGCRSISKLYIPFGYDLDRLFAVFYDYKYLLDHQKYQSNYDYHKSIFLMGSNKFLENGFLIMKEDISIFSPVSVLYYEYYKEIDDIIDFVNENRKSLQCVVSKGLFSRELHVDFGCSQIPRLWDYADNIDTIEFILSLD